MSTMLVRVDGREEEIQPANGSHWSLEELQTLIGGYIEVVRAPFVDGWLVVDEEGLMKRKQRNLKASLLVSRPIVGDAVFITTMLELNGPEEDDE